MSNYIFCPLCNAEVELDVEWAEKNGRLFCGTCCKSFEIKLEKNTRYPDPYVSDDNVIDQEDFAYYNESEEQEEEDD